MRPRHPRAAVLLLAIAVTACAGPSQTPPGVNSVGGTNKEGSTKPSAAFTSPTPSTSSSATGTTGGSLSPSAAPSTIAPRTVLAPLSGVVVAPASLVSAGGLNLIGLDGSTMVAAGAGNLIGMDGSTMVAAGAGNLVGNDGASMVAAGAGNYRLAQAAPRPIARARVALAIGGKLLPIPPVETADDGTYRFPQVPTGVTCQVVVAIKTPGGGTGKLMALAKAAEGGTVVDVSPATTMVTAAIVAKKERIGDVDPTAFQAACKRAGELLAKVTDPTQVPDLADQTGLIDIATKFLKTDAELEKQITTLATAVDTAAKSAEEAGDIARTEKAAGCPVAAPLNADNQVEKVQEPSAIALAADGTVFVGDRVGQRVLSYKAGEVAVVAKDVEPSALLVHASTGFLYIADAKAGGVSKVQISAGTTAAPQAVVPDLSFIEPAAMTLVGEHIYIADPARHQVLRFLANDGVTKPEVVAGDRAGFFDAEGAKARFYRPVGLAYDAAEDRLLVADAGNRRIRSVSLKAGFATATVVGGAGGNVDGPAKLVRFGQPVAIAAGADGTYWIADATNGTVRRLNQDGSVETAFNGCAIRAGALPVAGGLAFQAGSVYFLDGDRVMRRQVDFSAPATTPTPTPSATPSADGTASSNPAATPTPTPTPST